MTSIPAHTEPAVRDPDLVLVSGNIYAYVEPSRPNGRQVPVVRIMRILSLFYRDNATEDREVPSVMLSTIKDDELGRIGADVVELEINGYEVEDVIYELKAESVSGSAQLINGYALTRFVELGA